MKTTLQPVSDDDPLHFTRKYNNATFKDEQYPAPDGNETYRQYRARVDKLTEEDGFHLGDLTERDYEIYCKGSGTYRNFEGADELIDNV